MAYRPKDTQARILHRLKIAKGQLENVMKIVSADEYCIDILHQMQAVEKAIAHTEGIKEANTNYAKSFTEVTFDTDKLTKEKIQSIIKKVGYTAQPVN